MPRTQWSDGINMVAAERTDFHYGGHVMEIEAQKLLALRLQHMIWRVGLLPLAALYKIYTFHFGCQYLD